MNAEKDNLWKVLNNCGYEVNIFMDQYLADNIGLIPLTGTENVYHESIDCFLRDVKIRDNSFNLIYLPDLHCILGELFWSMDGLEEGVDFVSRLVDKVLTFYDYANEFDYIFMFSDHGFMLMDETKKYNHVIEDDRIKIMMFIHKKGDSQLCVDDKLRSCMDLFPTICDIIGYAPQNCIDGLSLFDEKGHEYVLVEDHPEFTVDISQTIEHWCVILNDGSHHWLECSQEWEHEKSEAFFDEAYFRNEIVKKMDEFEENAKQYILALRYQNQLKLSKEKGKYSDGGKFLKTVHRYTEPGNIEGKRVILYGAGNVGRDYYAQLKELGICEIVGWVDVNWESILDTPIKVKGINMLFEEGYDSILLCIYNRSSASSIRKTLEQCGISGDKILWSKPRFVRI